MIIKLNSASLLSGMQSVTKSVSTSNVIPALTNYLFDIRNTDIRIIGNNMETQISTKINCDSDGMGLFAAPQTLLQLLRALPNQGIELDINDLLLTVKYAGGSAEMPVIDGGEFPILKNDTKKTLVINGTDFAASIKKAAFAIDDDSSLPLGCLSVKITPNQLRITTCNRHVLCDITHVINGNVTADLMIPSKSIPILSELEGDISVIISKNTIGFYCENTSIICTLVDMDYPDVDSVIPKDNPIQSEVSRGHLLAAVKRTMTFANRETLTLKMDFADKLNISSGDAGLKLKGYETVACSGGELTIGLNAKYLADVLSRVDDDVLTFQMSAHNRAIMTKKDNELFLIMPAMLKN